jgi:acetolactate decarboxylase
MFKFFLLSSLFVLIGLVSYSQIPDAIHYTSLNSAIYLGQYDGDQSASDLKKFGNFGVGSEERLASELIMLDGKIYSVPASGELTEMRPQAKIPFAAVKFFDPEISVTIKRKLTQQEFEQQLDSVIGVNRFAAIKVTAKFSSITFRSYYEQQKPYKEISQAKEKFFDHQNFVGILVGFRTPKSADVLNSPVYHFHVIDLKKTTGGHLTDCVIDEAVIDIDYASQLIVDLPKPDKLQHVDLSKHVKKNN